ncbi:MAG: hypothetical protein ACPG6V_03240 [Flavobacteriales bacterium]
MEYPKYLMADNSQNPEKLFVVHTQDPHFIYDVMEEDFVWIEDNIEEVIGSGEEADLSNALAELIEGALTFCRSEMENMMDFDEE